MSYQPKQNDTNKTEDSTRKILLIQEYVIRVLSLWLSMS
jgi:hypothetical protein